MSRNRTKRNSITSDITLNDFANSATASNRCRIKKNAVKDVIVEVKMLNMGGDDRAWDEKLEDLLLPVDRAGQDEDFQVKTSSSRRKRKTTLSDSVGEEGNDYPIDIWFLISEYIAPEDAGKFAAICKSSYAVLNSAKFWFTLYKRYYKNVENLPEVLQPLSMTRRYGLRALVIRTLYMTYPKFVNRLHVKAEADPYQLIHYRCVLSWSQRIKQKEQWMFFFKLLRYTPKFGRGNGDNQKPDWLEMLDDINANVDHNCKVLQMVSNEFYPLPMVVGQMLTSVGVSLSRDLRHHCVQLQFKSGPSSYLSCSVKIDFVHTIHVLDWWHPAFPHGDRLNLAAYTRPKPICDFL